MTIYGNVRIYERGHGKEYDIDEYTLCGVPYHDLLEENIREHFEAWKAHVIAFEAGGTAMMKAIGYVVFLHSKDGMRT